MGAALTPVSPYLTLNPENWERKEIFQFFLPYEDPFFSITVPVDVTDLNRCCKEKGASFFLHYFHAALRALNQIQAFRLRFAGEELRDYNTIHAGCTVSRLDRTFGFGFFPYAESRNTFVENGLAVLHETRFGEKLTPFDERPDVAFFSVLPWLSFTSFKNPHRNMQRDAFPRVVFGRMDVQNGKCLMPVAVEVHHALVDGIHVGDFFQKFEEFLHPDFMNC